MGTYGYNLRHGKNLMDFNHFIILLATAFCFGAFGYVVGKSDMEKQAIKSGFAIYCPLTGEFGWLDECE